MIPRLYENAAGFHSLEGPSPGAFQPGRPIGATVHYTASGTAISALSQEAVSGLGYHIIIDRDGSVVQTCYFDRRVSHAGKAEWNKFSPNLYHVAIAVVSWGLLDSDGKNYLGKMPEGQIRLKYAKKWHAATVTQEVALVRLLAWLERNGMDRREMCGHDECCIPPGRKVDPGGTLSFTMAEYRRNEFNSKNYTANSSN